MPVRATGEMLIYGPGTNNGDLSVTTRVRIAEGRILSFRGEAFRFNF